VTGIFKIHPKTRPARRGFTLVELLLTLIVLLLILGAMVVNFAPLQQGAGLDEGAARFESLVRFAQAEAANSGRRLRMEFPQSTNEIAGPARQNIRLCWETDPVTAPGAFQEMPAARWDSDINDWIGVMNAHPLESELASGTSTNSELAPLPLQSRDETEETELASATPPAITFFPDGSTDSAQVALVSRDPEDRRTILVQVVGPTGWVRRETLSAESSEGDQPAPKSPGTDITGVDY